MNLALQPPRRPSNLSLSGIVAVARLTDKARAHVAETLGDFVYGNDSGLDRITLEFLGLDADDYADAASQYNDGHLAGWIDRATDLTKTDVAEFNTHHLRREPDEAGMARLKERIERYQPATPPTTVFASIELDDWGTFRECDLTTHAPRSPYDRAVAGIYGIARMADKARADKSSKLNDYIYDCPIDQAITTFLGMTADDYREAAWLNLNDIELGEWVDANSSRSGPEKTAFNAVIAARGPADNHEREIFDNAIARIAPGRIDITAWFDLLDLDDEASYGTTDLTRHAPRSTFNTTVGGLVHLARMIDKARAQNGGTLGDYWYGKDSGFDRRLLEFLNLTTDAFSKLVANAASDEDVLDQLDTKTESDRAAFYDDLTTTGPRNETRADHLRSLVLALDPSRTDITTYAAWTQLDDEIMWSRRKAGV